MDRPSPTDTGLFLLRIGLALVFIQAGFSKFSGGVSGVSGFFESQGIPGFFAGLVATAELFGGIGLLLGILPRFSAGTLAIVMLVSTTVVAFPNGGWSQARLDVLLLLGNLAIVVAGTGALTLPHLMGKPAMDVESVVAAKMRARRAS